MKKGAFIFVLFTVFHLSSFAQQCDNPPTGFTPISDLGSGTFLGMTGGLYGNGSNEIPPAHLQHGIDLAHTVVPLNASGAEDPEGLIGFVSMGMSNCNQFFSAFRQLTQSYPELNPAVQMVNCATGGYDIDAMLNTNGQYWTIVDQKLAQSGLTNNQIQVIWFEQAVHISNIPQGQNEVHINWVENKFRNAFRYFKMRYPNLKQIYCSGRDYGGYSNPNVGNPEPYAYYTGWSFRRLVSRQMAGDTALAFTGDQIRTAWLAWADYIWADGAIANADGFNWLCPGDVQSDGVHPNPTGAQKVGQKLLQFFSTDTTTFWFRIQPTTPTTVFAFDRASCRAVIQPNPTRETLSIHTPCPGLYELEILSPDGRCVMKSSGNTANIRSLNPGLYLVRISTSNSLPQTLRLWVE